jgi:putative ATPase
MKDEGYGAGYEYDHDVEGGVSGQNYFPDGLEREEFYKPTDHGLEREIGERLSAWRKLRGAREQSS